MQNLFQKVNLSFPYLVQRAASRADRLNKGTKNFSLAGFLPLLVALCVVQ